jgi:Icc-related predicted phosphoesterase
LNKRVFFVSDVHGSEKCFRKFVNAAKFYATDTLILGGDITGKVLVPITEQPDGRYRLLLFGDEVVAKKGNLPEYEREIADAGQYSFVASAAEMSELEHDKAKVDSIFLEKMKERLRGWLELAESRLKGTEVLCYISPGNDDKFEIDSVLKDLGHIVNPENRVVEVASEFEMITLGYANPTPWKSPRELPEEKLGAMIEALASGLKEPSKAIFNLHVPPYGTEIDKAPAVSEDFNYVKSGLGAGQIIPAGSTAVRESIEKHQPMLGLHGHIHESRGFVNIGRTLCINPGSEYSGGILRGALVNLEGGKVKEFLLMGG